MHTGPLPRGIVGDLEALKRLLADMAADDIDPEQTRRMALEISGIRLQLKRLGLEQQALLDRLETLRGSSSGATT